MFHGLGDAVRVNTNVSGGRIQLCCAVDGYLVGLLRGIRLADSINLCQVHNPSCPVNVSLIFVHTFAVLASGDHSGDIFIPPQNVLGIKIVGCRNPVTGIYHLNLLGMYYGFSGKSA